MDSWMMLKSTILEELMDSWMMLKLVILKELIVSPMHVEGISWVNYQLSRRYLLLWCFDRKKMISFCFLFLITPFCFSYCNLFSDLQILNLLTKLRY